MYVGKHCHIALSLSLSSVKESFSRSKHPARPWRGPFSKLKTTLNVSLLKHDRSLENSLEDEVKTNLWQLLMGNPN